MARIGAISTPSAQIHVGNYCNLACVHCYSGSSPLGSRILEYQCIEKFIKLIFEEGYEYLSFSGGEPLIYSEIWNSIDCGLDHGLQIGVVSNGTVVNTRIAKKLASKIGTAAISIDGPPHLHDQIRNKSGSFDKALRGIKLLQDAGMKVSVIHTLTAKTAQYIDDVLELCSELSIDSLQIHPLSLTGNAVRSMSGFEADRSVCSIASVLMELINPDINWSIDCFNRERVKEDYSILGVYLGKDPTTAKLSEIVNPIILSETARVLPYQYGVSSKYAICDVKEVAMDEQIREFRVDVFPKIQQKMLEIIPRVLDESKLPFFSWYDELQSELL